MKKILLFPVICILCVSCNDYSMNPNGNNQAQSQPSDWEITTNVKRTLMTDSSLSPKARMISVSTTNGVVTLTGTVANYDENRRVVKIVENVPGVADVNNQLTVANL